MGVPQVVIVGRPNVGKSSLLNWLAGKRIAIVDPAAGVTRDRVTQLTEVHDTRLGQDRFLELVDTGGIGIVDADDLSEHIEGQIAVALESASLVLLVVDVRSGLVPLDEEVARRLRTLAVPVLCVANKTDTPALESMAEEFHRLGAPVVRVSAEQKRGRHELIDAICEHLPAAEGDDQTPLDEPLMKLAIVGRRNVGKSTLVNTLARQERMIVSEVPGTTRDSVDVRFERDGKSFLAIDTPGFRRRQGMATNVDFYGTHRAQRSIRRADVVLVFFDVSEPASKVDKQLCDYVAEEHKPCIFVVTKWDLVERTARKSQWVEHLRDAFPTMRYVPVVTISGKTGRNVKTLLAEAQRLHRQSLVRVPTARLNKVVRAAVERNAPPLRGTRQPKIYYATQAAVQPPTIVLFCSHPRLLSKPYLRYLLGTLRAELDFAEVPIKLYLRHREASDTRGEIDAGQGPGKQ